MAAPQIWKEVRQADELISEEYSPARLLPYVGGVPCTAGE